MTAIVFDCSNISFNCSFSGFFIYSHPSFSATSFMFTILHLTKIKFIVNCLSPSWYDIHMVNLMVLLRMQFNLVHFQMMNTENLDNLLQNTNEMKEGKLMEYVVFVLLAYLLGSIPSALIVGKIGFKLDIREHGSGNLGATNTFRVLGVKAGAIVT